MRPTKSKISSSDIRNSTYDYLTFCSSIEDALEELIDFSLINREPETQALSIHRLIQFEYRDYIGAHERLRSFLTVSEQLYYKFPKQINGVSLRNDWVECKKYAQHILMLCAHWQRYRFETIPPGGLGLFIKSLTNCAWYVKSIDSDNIITIITHCSLGIS